MSDIKEKIEQLEAETEELEEMQEMKTKYRELKKKRSELEHPVFHSTIKNIKEAGKSVVAPKKKTKRANPIFPSNEGSPFGKLAAFSDELGFSGGDKSITLGKQRGDAFKELASIVKPKKRNKRKKKEKFRWY